MVGVARACESEDCGGYREGWERGGVEEGRGERGGEGSEAMKQSLRLADIPFLRT